MKERYLRVNYNDEEFDDYCVIDYQFKGKLNIISYTHYNEKEEIINGIIQLDNVISVEVYEDGVCIEVIDLWE